MRKPFVLSEYLADKSQRVETRDGDPVRIICTDAIGLPIPSITPTPIVALALHNGVEQLTVHSTDGRVLKEDSGNDLFLVTDAENEDERIRKEIISALKFANDGGVYDKHIAYLEKQKELPTNEEMLRTLRTEYEKGVADTIAKYEQKEQKPAERSLEDDHIIGFVYDLLNEIEWKDSWAMSKDECLRLLNNYSPQKPVEWSDTDNIGWDEAFACVTRAEKAAKNEEELQNAVTAEKWLKEIKFKYYVHPVKQEWSEEDGMETINVFRPLAGTSIENATKQAVNKFTNSGKKFLLAFNGVFLLIDNTKSVQDIVSEYNRSLGGKKKEQEQSEGEPNDFEITLNDCMLAAQQYPPGKIGWDDVKMWAEELSNYCPQPKQEWSEEDEIVYESIQTILLAKARFVEERKWFDSIKDRIKSAYWYEKDEKMYDRLIDRLQFITLNTRTDSTSSNVTFFDEIAWLKSLSERFSYKTK